MPFSLRSPHVSLLLLLALLAAAEGRGQTRAHARPTSGTDEDVVAGRQLLREQRYGEAMDRFEAALVRPGNEETARQGEIDAAIPWAASEVAAQHPDQAMMHLERAIQKVPDSPKLLVSFGLEAIALGQFPIAEQALHAADRVKPRDPTTTYALARLELEEQHMPEAERDLKTYLKARPNDATAYFGLGHVYAMEQRDDEARAAFQRSAVLQPRQTESYFQLGELEVRAHQDASAATLYRQVLARDPKHAGALTGMGQIALRARDYPRAEQYLLAAEQSDPSYAPPHYFRGLALARLGRAEEAKAEMARGDSRPHATPPPGASAEPQAQP